MKLPTSLPSSPIRLALTTIVLHVLVTLPATAQWDSTATRGVHAPHPRVAVVLSGGSAKGFAQIGALQVIEQAGIPVDLVTGTSMGAIIGGLYAMGYSPAELERIATTEDWSSVFKRPSDRRDRTLPSKNEDLRYAITFPLSRARPGLPTGVIPRQGMAELIERYTWPVSGDTDFSTLPSAFGALTTDLATGNAILLRSGSLSQAMQASAAVPGAFPPVRLSNGRLAVDGAVVRNIPASDARALGADIVICVDVSEHIAPVDSLHSLVDIVDQTVAFRVQWSNANELPLCNVVIDPDISGIPSVDFGLAREWIARGRKAALAKYPQLTAIADSVRRLRGPLRPRSMPAAPDSVFVHAVRWTPVSPGADGIVRGTHDLRDSSWLTRPEIEQAVSRLYSTGRFDEVSFRLVPVPEGYDLWFDLAEGDRDVLGVGGRYDTAKGVALLGSVSLTDLLSAGSTTTLTARLGTDQMFDVRDVIGASPNARFTQTYRATALRSELPALRTEPTQIAAPVVDLQSLAASFEGKLGSAGAVGVELGHAWSHDGAPGGPAIWNEHARSFGLVAGTLEVDTFDRSILPTRGFAFTWRSQAAAADDRNVTFTRHVVSVQGARALSHTLTLTAGVNLGDVIGNGVPPDQQFMIGGAAPSYVWPTQFVPFLGIPSQSRMGTAVQVAQAGVRAQLTSNLVVTALANAGNVFGRWPPTVARDGYIVGSGITMSTMLPVGPASLTIASRGLGIMPVVEMSAGSVF